MTVLKIGIVGAGGIAHPHLAAWRALGASVVVYSLDGKAPELVGALGWGTVVGSLGELFDRSDIIDVCTPTFTHREIVEAAAAANKDVICEKPFALTTSDALAMRDACDRAGSQLYPAHVVRFYPEYACAREAVVGGLLGRPAVARFSRLGARPAASWFTDPLLSGGIAMDQMIHDIDYARWTLGEVHSVFATATSGAEGDPQNVHSVQAVLTHSTGTVTSAVGTWGSPTTTFQTTFEIAGSEGLIGFDSLQSSPFVTNGASIAGNDGYLPSLAAREDPILTELREISEAIAGRATSRISAEDGIRAVEIAEAINTSIASSQAVRIGGER
ncbi:Gfo/Idh/MocA family protein [Leifsonia aquatica]|uniref:Gfo/Idh/MocA family protein n=1 Tax=Leifsonia aquatica TaxID=144185 RepID=UPI0028AA6691|nr:Gfo/Idh/MocA family oxidoreductase [Leifsonia aquatica]